MYKEQIIYLNKSNTDIQIGKILKLNNQDNCLYGIISEQTIIFLLVLLIYILLLKFLKILFLVP